MASLLAERGLRGPLALVSDETVGALYAAPVDQSLRRAGYASKTILLPPGERHKTIHSVTSLWEGFLQAGVERGSTVLALGGGVVGDLTGFAAATWLRGVAWVYRAHHAAGDGRCQPGRQDGRSTCRRARTWPAPSTPPSLVLADPRTLETLPAAELRSGLAEALKHGLIGDPRLFELLAAGGSLPLEEIVRRSMAVKVRVIQADPYEQGLRAALNLGHTVGHALELVTQYGLRHGEAVAIGMVAAARLAERARLAETGLAGQITAALQALGLPAAPPTGLECGAVLQALYRDKKRQAGAVRFVLPRRVGEVSTGVVIENLEEELCRLF